MTCTSSSRGAGQSPRPAPRHALGLATRGALASAAFLAALLVCPSPIAAQDSPEPKPLRSDDGTLLGAVDSVNASILTVVGYPPPSQNPNAGTKRKRLIGTAVALSEKQLLASASIAIPGGSIRVLLGGGIERPAVVLGIDRGSNVALLQVEGATLRPLRPAPPQSLAIGSWVAVISNVAVTRPQAALGRVVGRGERIDYALTGEILEIDAPSYPGSTGGAVLNEEGDWVAVIVGRAVPTPPAPGSGVGLDQGGSSMPEPNSVLIALPVDQVVWLKKELETYGNVRRGYLGIQLRRERGAPSESLGVLVTAVIDDSPADSAGIRAGDRILAIQGSEAHTADELTAIVRATRPGDVVEITVLRKADIFPVRVVVGAAFPQPPIGPRRAGGMDPEQKKQELKRLQDEKERLERQIRALEGTPER